MEAWEKRAEVEPNNPEAHHTIATWLQEKAMKDVQLPTATKRAYIDRAIAAEDSALALHENYVEALVFKNILLRMKAQYERDRRTIDALLAEADRLRDKAIAIQNAQNAGGRGGGI